MAALDDAFQQSYLNFVNYPQNLISKGTATYRSKLRAYTQHLDEIESQLCLVDPRDVEDVYEIPIHDLPNAAGQVIRRQNIHSEDKLTDWLGVTVSPNGTNLNDRTVSVRHKDPKCRFIYIYAENSRDQLKITRRSLTQILTYHQVMPVYLEFMFVFGAQSGPKDLRFSGFREQITMKAPPRAPAMPQLGRSGRQFQLCYNLKGVTHKVHSSDVRLDEWSIRQAAIYHRFDIVFGTMLWIVTKGRLDIEERFSDLTGKDGLPEDKSFDTLEECFRSSLAAHLLYAHWSTEDWRRYIQWLENLVDKESAMAIYGTRGPGYAHKQYKPHHIQDLQYWQDKTNEAVLILKSNLEVIGSVRRFYLNLKDQKDFPDLLKQACSDDLATFGAHLDEIMDDFRMQISRAELLASIISDRKELILQHLQGQATERTEQLNKNLEREAIVMRIITIVTLLYLPATFVSTFFSTDIIKYQDQNGGSPGTGTFSDMAMKRWLQVTLPLTTVTLLAAWSAYQIAETKRRNPGQAFLKSNPFVRGPQRPSPTHQIDNEPGIQPAIALDGPSKWNPLQHFISRSNVRSAPEAYLGKASMLPFHNRAKKG